LRRRQRRLQTWCTRHAPATRHSSILRNALHLGERAPWFKALSMPDSPCGGEPPRLRKKRRQPHRSGALHRCAYRDRFMRNTRLAYLQKNSSISASLAAALAVHDGDRALAGAFSAASSLHVSGDARCRLYPFVIGVRNGAADKYDSLSKIARSSAASHFHGAKTPSFRCAMAENSFAAAND